MYFFPPIHDRLAWRVENIRAKIIYAFNPPEEAVFVPQAEAPTPLIMTQTLVSPTATPTLTITVLAEIYPTSTPNPTTIPSTVYLTGIVHEYQKWNNCAPANLAMMLSYWGWKGDQRDTAAALKPNPRDNNVMPDEIVAYVQKNTNLKAISRSGGSLDLLKQILAAGFPVLVEKGLDHDNGWIGHYETISGYDDSKQKFIAQDSFIIPNLPVPYEQMEKDWRAFNNIFIVIYPSERENELKQVMQGYWDSIYSYQKAYENMKLETQHLSGRNLVFAWFNLGTNAVALEDYPAAAKAYDKYFALYSSLPKKDRPWRMMWYQNGPYLAYYYTERYKDVIALATVTLGALSEKLLEEGCYWRAKAKLQIGDEKGAISDFQQAVERNPFYVPAREELEKLQPNKLTGQGNLLLD